jgi:hypothetical protein
MTTSSMITSFDKQLLEMGLVDAGDVARRGPRPGRNGEDRIRLSSISATMYDDREGGEGRRGATSTVVLGVVDVGMATGGEGAGRGDGEGEGESGEEDERLFGGVGSLRIGTVGTRDIVDEELGTILGVTPGTTGIDTGSVIVVGCCWDDDDNAESYNTIEGSSCTGVAGTAGAVGPNLLARKLTR